MAFLSFFILHPCHRKDLSYLAGVLTAMLFGRCIEKRLERVALRVCESRFADNLAQLETQSSDQQMQQKELMQQILGRRSSLLSFGVVLGTDSDCLGELGRASASLDLAWMISCFDAWTAVSFASEERDFEKTEGPTVHGISAADSEGLRKATYKFDLWFGNPDYGGRLL